MKSVLEGVVGELDLTGCEVTPDGRRILAAEIVLEIPRGGAPSSLQRSTYLRQGYRPQVDLIVHDKKGKRVTAWSAVILADDFLIPAGQNKADSVLEGWIWQNREIADRLETASEAALAAVNARKVEVLPNEHISDIASRTLATIEAGDDAA